MGGHSWQLHTCAGCLRCRRCTTAADVAPTDPLARPCLLPPVPLILPAVRPVLPVRGALLRKADDVSCCCCCCCCSPIAIAINFRPLQHKRSSAVSMTA